MLNIIQLTYNFFREKAAVAWKEAGRCVIVDPGCCSDEEKADLLAHLEKEGLRPEAILLTHAHFDHIYGVKFLQDRFGIPVYMSADDKKTIEYVVSEMSDRFAVPVPDCSFKTTDIRDGEVLSCAGISFEVISTPGHTPGGVCYLDREDKVMFSGDTLFAGAIGRTDLKYSDYDDEIRSIMEKLIFLDPDITIYPGHGHSSTIGHERSHNPFLEPFNEEAETSSDDVTPVIISGN